MTRFSGVRFSAKTPYNYLEAKRVLGLLRGELLQSKRLRRQLNADPRSEGRGAITGTRGSSVWDYISLREARSADAFTRFPHLTIGIHDNWVEAFVTFPNGLRRDFRKNLIGDDFENFRDVVGLVAKRLRAGLKREKGALPQLVLLQRHYPSQRSHGIIDAALKFDLRTTFGGGGNVRQQNEWLKATYQAFRNKRSNLQLQLGACFPYDTSQHVASPKLVDLVADAWIACQPIIQLAIKSPSRRDG